MQPKLSSTMPTSDGAPFYYASFAGLWVYYLVKLNTLNAVLAKSAPGFSAFDFGGGVGLANINFMTYAGHSGINDPNAYIDILKPVSPPNGPMPASLGVEGSNECEFNIVCYPTARVNQVPVGLTIPDFIAGNDHTKTLGNFRIGVPCDDRIAVYWGTVNFGENKIMTHPFLYNVPSPNNPVTSWQFTVPGEVSEPFIFNTANNSADPYMLWLGFDASNIVPTTSNASEIIDYSLFTENGATRPVGSRRNILGVFSAYDLTKTPPNVAKIILGNSKHPLVNIMGMVLMGAPAVAAQTFQSQPAVAESSMYYVDL